MPDIKLSVIPEPAEGTRTVFKGETKPLMRSAGSTNYLCGKCGEILVKGGQAKNIVLRCPSCGSYNELA